MAECKFNKVLVANRGEIAIRVFRACYDLGLHTVAMYSNEDTFSLFRTKADEAYLIGENKSPLGAYLDIPSIIDLARRRNVDAIHPGYGFLSENADFARACEEAGITFIGPSSTILAQMGDKLTAKAIAHACGVPTIPGSDRPLKDGEEALAKAVEYGFPIILKAAGGGGGRGMRRCDTPEEVIPAFDLVKSEAKKAFGNEDIFIEKYLVEPKHIEVQILGDKHGNVVHLFERDCSLQRRYQKVVEFAPAFSVPEATRQKLYEDAVKVARHVGYVSAGTVEFLVDKSGNHYFIEMNPRIQVEHTVTEMVTGVDLVRAQILIAEGHPLSTPEIGIPSQDAVHMNGYALQCRVTTEDPANNFAPDTGKITAYRSGGGFGVRLDGGNAFTGAEISPYYDSLLVKVTSWDNTFEGVCRKAMRAISEEHVRGVKTNIPFVTNILAHPTFRAGACHTKFIDETPELFDIDVGRDRATKLLKYIAQIQVDNPSAERAQFDIPRFPPYEHTPPKCTGLKQLLDEKGPEAVRDWVLGQKKLLITDTTMRDAHQSLLSTRVRTRDMLKAAEGTAEILNDCFSLEMWGGATFDVAYRFLLPAGQELVEVRERMEAVGLPNCAVTAFRSRVPQLPTAWATPERLDTLNCLAIRLMVLAERDSLALIKYKAVLEVSSISSLEDAMALTEQLDAYNLNWAAASPEDVARGELRRSMGEENAALLCGYLNLYGYGEALIRQYGGDLTDYGLLTRADGQPVQKPLPPQPGLNSMGMRCP